jgi:hypothetical protein
MGLTIEDGIGKGYQAKVDSENRLTVNAKTNVRGYFSSRDQGNAYSIVAEDADPAAGEYTVWVQNNSTNHFIVSRIITGSTDADVVWKLWQVTGTGATAAAITPKSLNLALAISASLTAKGGAGGVTGLTTSGMITMWNQGVANSTFVFDSNDMIRIGQNQAIALEYDAGTTNACSITILGYFDVVV